MVATRCAIILNAMRLEATMLRSSINGFDLDQFQSVRNHFCREAIRSLPTEVLEPVLCLDIELIPMLKQLSQ